MLERDAESGFYVVSVPALPGCFTQGKTVEQAINRAREAIKCHVDGLRKLGEDVPEETAPPQVLTLEVAA